MNILNVMYLYNRIVEDPSYNPPARTFIFGAKSASGYRRAKSIIKLINTVAERVNNDRRVRGKIRVVFVENYRVSVAEKSSLLLMFLSRFLLPDLKLRELQT